MGVTAEHLRDILEYDASTGHFKWKRKTCCKVVVGKSAGFVAGNGYKVISIGGIKYPAHRLAWLYVYGTFPEFDTDHINGDPLDNRIVNLRAATRRQNMANKKMHKNNSSGVKGVYWCIQRKKWRASVRINGRNKHAGFFDDKEAAGAAYLAKAKELFGDFATQRDR